jgi:multiple sugar transport system substrate-binding protein
VVAVNGRALTLALVGALAWSSGAAAAPPTVINFVGWGGPEEHTVITNVLADFERLNPDLHVKYTQIPGGGYDYFNKVRLMIVANIAPDVYYVPDGNFGELASRNVLLNLDPYVEKSHIIKLADMWGSGYIRYQWDGHQLQKGPLYCLPKDIGPWAMFYNQDVFKARGVPFPSATTPMSWDEAIAMWQKLTFKQGNIRHYGVSTYPHESAVWSNGGEIISADKRHWVLGKDPKSIQAVQWCADLNLVHHVAPDLSRSIAGSSSASPGELFESGLAACHFDGRWMVPRYRTATHFGWDVAPFPVPHKGQKPITFSGSVGFGIYAKTKVAAASFRLIEYLAGPEGQAAMTKTGFQVPNQRALSHTEVYLQRGQKPAHAEVFLDMAANSRPGPWTDTPNTFWHDVYWNFVGKVFRGDKRATDLLPTLVPMVDNALVENNDFK